MDGAAGCRILALIGSGETSPTMVTVHRELIARLGVTRPHALLLATPYAFQENATGVSAKAQKYFAESVGLEVTVVAGTGAAGAGPGSDAGLTAVRAADWVFAGPGSPSYALTHWRDGPVAAALHDRICAGHGVTVLASAAAATAGYAALPVYEIYKAGAPPHWLDGLDLLGALGLRAAVIPHYDNTEGQGYDSRYCYLGERRLAVLERELPADAAVLGVDEHTAAIIDMHAGTIQVAGRGGLTVRRTGVSTILPSGTSVTLKELRDLVRGNTTRPPPARASASRPEADSPPAALPDLILAAGRSFDAAAARRDAPAMIQAILGLETAISDWDADTDEDQGTEQARAVLRSLITRLGQAAQAGLDDPRDPLLPAVDPLLALRAALRQEGRYSAADTIRDALAAAGFGVQDTPDGTRWEHRLPAA
jgi:cyanophycinase-like exopeptidase